MQLTIDGGEVPWDAAPHVAVHVPLSPTQQDILAWAKLHGGLIRPVQAGVIVHRERPTHRKWGGDIDQPGEPLRCCAYASSDGVEALKRLMKRGLVERVGKGLYCVVGW